ncbi:MULTISPECIES: DUF6241 domain-containing protein [unclassified Romboutsia]|uniref:DUF6241 domain-containing protein n=1 Tax=unclassified Romboutsia TaxID=2626894 RepID=UPI000820FC32|nr:MULTISPECIES: DUF6241 domain-containing protein [unclassified Romboutsia]SCH53218.1 Uncharacterised protein [uncultured Clostridium sp.]
MSKNNKIINDKSGNEIENISLEELDLEMNEFYIDKEKINSIKAPNDMKIWIKESIDKAELDIKKSKNKKRLVASAASIFIIFSVGVYNPALAHKIPILEMALRNINSTLKIDELAYRLGIDNIVPKATLDKDNKIKFVKPIKYKVNNVDNISEDQEDEILSSINDNSESPKSEYLAVQFIHKMSNSIINPIDNKKYGNIEITPKSIELAISGLEYIKNNEARNYLYAELNKWKKGEFRNAVEVHNYVWNILDGQVGKAISINEERIEDIINNYFNN